MNYQSNWFSALDTSLEWPTSGFQIRLHFHAKAGMIPLGGLIPSSPANCTGTVARQFRAMMLTEDADLGMRFDLARRKNQSYLR